MDLPTFRSYRLVPRGGAGLACDDDGVALGPVPLAQAFRDAAGQRRVRLRPAAELAKALRLAYGPEPEDVVARRCAGLGRVAAMLEAGEDARARIRAVQLGFPEIPPEGMAKLARAEALRKFNPHVEQELRILRGETGAGEWTSGGGGQSGSEEARLEPAADKTTGATPADKARFVAAHLADAEAAAKELNVPVENILGLSALESGWETSRAAKEGNNYFGLHSPAPFQVDSTPALDNPKVGIAIFTGYADSLRSFVAESGGLVRGKSDPAEFATVLQNSGRYGIGKHGEKIETYVGDVARTIRGLRPYIEREKKKQKGI